MYLSPVTKPVEYSMFPCETWKDVRIYTAQLIPGTVTLRHYGVIEVEFSFEKLESAFVHSEELIMRKAFSLGGNAVQGWESHISLWDSPMMIRSFGSCTILGPI